jgi:hypothetical protein
MYPACCTHAPLISLADRFVDNRKCHQILGAYLDPFHSFISIANCSRCGFQIAAAPTRCVSNLF